VLATGVHSYPSVYHLFSFYFQVIFKLYQPIHEAQIYFVFLSVGNPKTVLKGGYVGWLCKLFDKALVESWFHEGSGQAVWLWQCACKMRWHFKSF
jgi:hypothetical protein